jgi:hypothetical protein
MLRSPLSVLCLLEWLVWGRGREAEEEGKEEAEEEKEEGVSQRRRSTI